MATEGTLDTSAAGTCVDASGGAIGMPQLCFDWFPNQIFWLLVTLVVIYFVLTRVALPRIATVLAERQGTITNDLAAAEDLKLKAEEAEKAYEKALADARAEAQTIVNAAKAEMQAEMDDATAKADAEIAARVAEADKAIAKIRDGAMDNVQTVAKDIAGEIVEAMGGTADASALGTAIDSRVKG